MPCVNLSVVTRHVCGGAGGVRAAGRRGGACERLGKGGGHSTGAVSHMGGAPSRLSEDVRVYVHVRLLWMESAACFWMGGLVAHPLRWG